MKRRLLQTCREQVKIVSESLRNTTSRKHPVSGGTNNSTSGYLLGLMRILFRLCLINFIFHQRLYQAVVLDIRDIIRSRRKLFV